MPATLSKEEEAAAARRKRGVLIIVGSLFFSVLQHCAQSASEPMLIKQLLNDDPAATAQVLSTMSTIIGVSSLFVNQVGQLRCVPCAPGLVSNALSFLCLCKCFFHDF